ncbi:MAG: F0F1 ATP synthase subunit B' [Pikeienuella sp.]|uniref:F0F1 ATP synthase subunit B family protein n=1 Tax=Pikeienuella sp. TaxID=2831957 RepID=UPI0039189281
MVHMRISAVMASGAALLAAPALAATEGEAKGGMPQLNFDSWGSQIFWLVVSLVVLFLLMKNVILPRIAAGLEERSEKIEDDLDRAATFRRDAEAAEAAYEKALADARAKAQEIAQGAKDAVQADYAAAVAKADAEIAARAAEGEKRIAEIGESAAEAVSEVAADTAGAVIEAVAPGMGDDKAARAAVSELLGR